MVVAATPAWFADNIVFVAGAVLVILTVLVLRSIEDRVTRAICLGLIVAVAVFVFVNRAPLKACAATCECEIADQDLSVPFCDPNLELSKQVTLAPPHA